MLTQNETRLDVLRAVAEGRVTHSRAEGYWIRLPGMDSKHVTITRKYCDALVDLDAHNAIFRVTNAVMLTPGGWELLKQWTA
jgi:hypothetical protein